MRNLLFGSVAIVALAWAQHSIAAPTNGSDMKSLTIGGLPVMCGLKKSEADDEKRFAEDADKMELSLVTMSVDDGKKLLDVLNAAAPVTTLKAEKVIAYRGEQAAIIFVVNADRLCALHPMPTKLFDSLADQAFGAGS